MDKIDKNILIQIAKKSIEEDFLNGALIDTKELKLNHPFLNEQRATFVTLTLNEELRGCIGSLIAQRNLIDDIAYNAKAAAFSDFRFNRLSEAEFKNIKIEISILSEPKSVSYKNIDGLKSKINRDDGIILEHNGHSATFLPQVWEQLPKFELFFANLCQKAGLYRNCLELSPNIYKYQVQKFKED